VEQRYLIALGSNVRHARHGRPEAVLRAALTALGAAGIDVLAAAPVMRSRPLGPSRRAYANSAVLIACELMPPQLLSLLKQIERAFGRRPGGQRWAARVLDCDIAMWSGGAWASPGLTVPHLAMRERGFVLGPAAAIAPGWRDPVAGLTLRQLSARLTRPRPLPRAPRCAGP
jgi:2-amino-4-hydroxy-6-hydroxymethyldihydropteridine diphosphokinase